MFDPLKNDLKDAIRYPFLDWKIILITGGLLFAITILNKSDMSKIGLAISLLKSLDFSNLNQNRIIPIITSILVFVEIGYGSRIVFKGLLGENKPPQYNKLKKLVWEGFKKYCIILIYGIVGFKKYCIILIYGIVMTFLFNYAQSYFLADNIPLSIIFFILFIFVYLTLIGAILNRYENNGKFFKAFDYNEIFGLLKDYGAKYVLIIFICAVIAQTFTVTCFVDITPNTLSLLEIGISILTFFLAPITAISTKRLVSLNLRRVYDEKDGKLKSDKKDYF